MFFHVAQDRNKATKKDPESGLLDFLYAKSHMRKEMLLLKYHFKIIFI
jgi:hypothetical protein